MKIDKVIEPGKSLCDRCGLEITPENEYRHTLNGHKLKTAHVEDIIINLKFTSVARDKDVTENGKVITEHKAPSDLCKDCVCAVLDELRTAILKDNS